MTSVDELYCQVNGKVYVSRDEEPGKGSCRGCHFDIWVECPIGYGKANGVCSRLKIIWKELEVNE